NARILASHHEAERHGLVIAECRFERADRLDLAPALVRDIDETPQDQRFVLVPLPHADPRDPEAKPAGLPLATGNGAKTELLGPVLATTCRARQPEQGLGRLRLACKKRLERADVIVLDGTDQIVEGAVGVDAAAFERRDAEAVLEA